MANEECDPKKVHMVVLGKVTKKELRDSLQQPRETRFNFIAPAHGLYLWKIKY